MPPYERLWVSADEAIRQYFGPHFDNPTSARLMLERWFRDDRLRSRNAPLAPLFDKRPKNALSLLSPAIELNTSDIKRELARFRKSSAKRWRAKTTPAKAMTAEPSPTAHIAEVHTAAIVEFARQIGVQPGYDAKQRNREISALFKKKFGKGVGPTKIVEALRGTPHIEARTDRRK